MRTVLTSHLVMATAGSSRGAPRTTVRPGQTAFIYGLRSAKELNGALCRVLAEPSAETGRVPCQLAPTRTPGSTGGQLALPAPSADDGAASAPAVEANARGEGRGAAPAGKERKVAVAPANLCTAPLECRYCDPGWAHPPLSPVLFPRLID